MNYFPLPLPCLLLEFVELGEGFKGGERVNVYLLQFLYYMFMPSLPGSHAVKCAENSSIAATQILIALKCHTLERGGLPESLEALVPEYFRAIPLDDFDGKPMKYSKEERVVYSVGSDLVDNGGVAKDDKEGIHWGDGYDVIYKITF